MMYHSSYFKLFGATLIFVVFALSAALAQSNTMTTANSSGNQDVADDEKVENYSEVELNQFEMDILDLIEQTESHPTLEEHEISIRIFYYELVQDKLFNGISIEFAPSEAIPQSKDYAEQFVEGDSIDFQKLKSIVEDELE